jgi:hypothetical protein
MYPRHAWNRARARERARETHLHIRITYTHITNPMCTTTVYVCVCTGICRGAFGQVSESCAGVGGKQICVFVCVYVCVCIVGCIISYHFTVCCDGVNIVSSVSLSLSLFVSMMYCIQKCTLAGGEMRREAGVWRAAFLRRAKKLVHALCVFVYGWSRPGSVCLLACLDWDEARGFGAIDVCFARVCIHSHNILCSLIKLDG